MPMQVKDDALVKNDFIVCGLYHTSHHNHISDVSSLMSLLTDSDKWKLKSKRAKKNFNSFNFPVGKPAGNGTDTSSWSEQSQAEH